MITEITEDRVEAFAGMVVASARRISAHFGWVEEKKG
jgi:hypothetical protein